MRCKKAWMLLLGLLLVIVTSGFGDKPVPVAEPRPVGDPNREPVAEIDARAEPAPVAEEAKQSPSGPQLSRDAAIAEIKRLGGACLCDEASPDKPIVSVFLLGKPIADTDLVHLKGLTNLQYLDLTHTQVTDAGLGHLKELANLKGLRLWHTEVSDAGLARRSLMLGSNICENYTISRPWLSVRPR